MTQSSTIAAISTPPGQGGVGIVRISGPKAKAVFQQIWRKTGKPVDKFETHRFYLGKVVDEKGIFLDEVLAVWMQGPNSYTGEDVIEIQAHGSRFLLERILKTCIVAGASLAGPGEFTQRAYLNGKLDLIQAEAVADLIGASSEVELKCAQEQLAGKLSAEIKSLQQKLLELRAFVEAKIDFPEEDIEMIRSAEIAEKLYPIQKEIEKLVASYQTGKLYKEGVVVTLVGRPNVGKSSLLNALLREERAIVHETPGTTRDVIEETVLWGGIQFRLIDTAGLREAEGEVEALGVLRTQNWIERADIVLWILDSSESKSEEDEKLEKKLSPEKTWVILNKSDLSKKLDEKFLTTPWKRRMGPCISAKKGNGLGDLRNFLIDQVNSLSIGESGGVVVTQVRHKEALEAAAGSLRKTAFTLEQKLSSEFIAYHLEEANRELGKITGEVTTEDLLGEIFSRFCIGK